MLLLPRFQMTTGRQQTVLLCKEVTQRLKIMFSLLTWIQVPNSVTSTSFGVWLKRTKGTPSRLTCVCRYTTSLEYRWACFRACIYNYLTEKLQFNAVVDLTTESGTAIYGGAWTGPPSAIFSQSNQTTAISALLSAMILDDVDPTSSISDPPPPPASSSTVPHSAKTPVSVVAGSVVGSVVLVVIGVALWFVLRRRKRIAGPESSLAMSSVAPRPVTAVAVITASQTSPTSPTHPRNSIVKFDSSFEQSAQRHCVNEQAAQSAQSPVDTVNAAISPTSPVTLTFLQSSSVTVLSPVEQLPTTELVRVLNERLRGRQWDEGEVPPQYGTEQ